MNWYIEAVRKGLIIEDRQPPAAEPDRMVPGAYADRIACKVWTLPIVTASEANGRDWRKRSNRTKQAREIVSKAFGPVMLDDLKRWYHCERMPLDLLFTRLATRKLDAANLPVALKATEDAVALMLGCDDGDPRWRAMFEQEVGNVCGVRISISYGEW